MPESISDHDYWPMRTLDLSLAEEEKNRLALYFSSASFEEITSAGPFGLVSRAITH